VEDQGVANKKLSWNCCMKGSVHGPPVHEVIKVHLNYILLQYRQKIVW